ncbi:MAG: serine-protein kinase RsbW [Methanobacterium sp. PtaU1.Bin242]|nr:MAG: serine-protein kinase RsbW [Methanobacterium sp. PtaU1.Bin242]
MQASILEKEVLLKEIHHRVKNNLQIISSLLNLQSIRIKDDTKAFEVFKESQNRVKTMAMIHEKLYQSGNFAQIDFSQYIHNLISSIFSSYGVNTGDIKLKITGQDVFLDINTAIPCGLIINELVTNTIKHAFSPGNSGKLHVSFDKTDDKYVLTVQDNGNGLPDDFDIEKTDTLGLELVKSLVYQLEGKLGVINGDGAIFRISFREQ